MARLNKKAELFSHLTEVGIMRPKLTATTLGSAVAAGATVMNPAFIDGAIVADDYGILGSGESMEVFQLLTATPAFEAKSGFYRAHAIGEYLSAVSRTVLGDLSDEGVSLVLAEGDFNAILSATQREPVGYLAGHIAQMAEFSVLNLNPENLATALGMAEGAIVGTGSAADPTVLDLVPDAFAAEDDLAFYFKGVRKDGLNIEVQLWGVEVDPTALSQALQFARGQQMPTPFRLRPTAGVRWLSYT